MNEQRLALYLLTAAETFHSSSQFMPDLSDIHDKPYDQHRGDVRRGEIYAGTWSFIVSLIIAHATNSTVPLVIWLTVSAATCGIYEYHLRT